MVLSQRIFAATDPHQRDHLLDELLTQGPIAARQPFFNLLADPSTASAASAAVCRHAAQWTETLFAALSEPRIAVRISAANALAQIDGPVITGRLIAMADAGMDRREAVTALVQIQSTDARRFVASAMQSPDLSGLVRSAIAQSSANQIQTGVIQ
jgi:HEAT repeat protein